MALNPIPEGITGQQAAEIILANDEDNATRITDLEQLDPGAQLQRVGAPDYDNAGNLPNYSIDASGNLVNTGNPNFMVSYPIPADELTKYVWSGIFDDLTRAVRFEDASNNKVGYVLTNKYPYVFETPAGTEFIRINFKAPGGDDTRAYIGKVSDQTGYKLDTQPGKLKLSDYASKVEAAQFVGAEHLCNLFEDGNTNQFFWTKAQPAFISLSIVDNTTSNQVGRLQSLQYAVAGAGTGGSAFFTRMVYLPNDEDIVVGFWVRLAEVAALAGGTQIGLYPQWVNAAGDVIGGAPVMLTATQIQVKGNKETNLPFVSEVAEISDGWAYIKTTKNGAAPAGTKGVLIHFFLGSLATGNATIRLSGITALYGTDINPYLYYSNRLVRKTTHKKITMDGDSIIDQGHLPAAITQLSKCFMNKSIAVSGSGYTTNGALVQPPFIDAGRMAAITASKPDIIILEGGVNDARVGAPLGDFATMETDTDYSKFYPAVYKRLSTIVAANPLTPIIVLTPMPSFYYVGWGDPDRDNVNKPNGIGLYQYQYADAVKRVAEYLGLPCLDLFRLTVINKFTAAVRTDDGLHPGAGYDSILIAKLILNLIEPYL